MWIHSFSFMVLLGGGGGKVGFRLPFLKRERAWVRGLHRVVGFEMVLGVASVRFHIQGLKAQGDEMRVSA